MDRPGTSAWRKIRARWLGLAVGLFGWSALGDVALAEEVSVEVELVLLADSSSSIRGQEFELQISGYANAFRDQGVIDVIAGLGGNGIAVTFVQWSASFQQLDTVPWTLIRNRAEAEAFARAIESQARRFQGFGTATGAAMRHGADLFGANGFAGQRKIIDITSDEHSNQGPHPKGIRDGLLSSGVTINGLAILDDAFDLDRYFKDFVVGGPNSFVLAVETYRDFAEAIKLKLIREISDLPVAGYGGVPPGPSMALNCIACPRERQGR